MRTSLEGKIASVEGRMGDINSPLVEKISEISASQEGNINDISTSSAKLYQWRAKLII